MMHTPDEKQIEQMLEAIPSELEFEPSANLDQRLSNAPWTRRATARRRVLTIIPISLLILALITTITPQGRVLAQSILQFFIRTEGDTRPVPTLVLDSRSDISKPNQESSSPFAQMNYPFETTCGDIYHPLCTLDEIRQMVSFQVKGLGEIGNKNKLFLTGTTGGPDQVILVYLGENLNGSLIIIEEQSNSPDKNTRSVAENAEVELVSINGSAGEYVQGGWYSVDTNGGISWFAEPFMQTLRWEADSIRYTMMFRAGKGTGNQLEKSDLLSLAQNMSSNGNTNHIPSIQPLAIPEISQKVGFQVVEPGWVPEGYSLLKTDYTPNQNAACLYYRYREGSQPVLAIAERPSTTASILDDISITTLDLNGEKITIPVVTESIPLGGAQNGKGLLVSNAASASKLCPEKDFIANQALTWQFDNKDYIIFGLIDQYKGGVFISPLEMRRLAENLTGVATIPQESLDPGRLHSIADIQSLAGFAVKSPIQMIPGLQLDHAAFYQTDAQSNAIDGPFNLVGGKTESVVLIYTLENNPTTHGGYEYGFFITESAGDIRTRAEIHQWGGFEDVKINGQPAQYRLFCWEPPTGGNDCYQELYWQENGIGYGFFIYLPGALDKDQVFAIAESMQ